MHRHLECCPCCGLHLGDVHRRTRMHARTQTHTHTQTLPDTLLLNLLGGGAVEETQRDRRNIILEENCQYLNNKEGLIH